LKETDQANLIPIPHLSCHHPTPELFGEPLVIGGWSNTRDSWLLVNATKFIMPWTRAVSVILFTICQNFNKLLVKFKGMVPPVSLSPRELRQIDFYRTALRTKKSTAVIDDGTVQAQPPAGGGPGSGIGLEGDGSGPVLDGFGSGSQGLLILEDVDVDAQDEDCTFRDELFLMALCGGPETLERFLQAERKERDEIQKQHAARLDDWRHAVAFAP
jgi:hypothetical protein